MDFLFIYLIKSSLSLIVLYLSYEFFFRKEAYFRFSRYLLLMTVFVVILLPLLPYNAANIISNLSFILKEMLIYSRLAHFTLDEVVITASRQPDYIMNTISIGSIILAIYFLGVIIKIIQFLIHLIQIQTLISRSKTLNKDGLNFVFVEKSSPTYSFLKWIFIDPELFNRTTDFTAIVSHEKIHAAEGHTYDLILAEVLTIIQWFNPFAYLLKKTIKENHEYITDHKAISKYKNTDRYQLLLLQHSSIIKTNILTHNFSYSLLKRRLKMMKKSKHTLGFGLRLLVLSTTLVLIFFACSSPDGNISQDENQKATEIEVDDIFLVVEVMPEYIGGTETMYEFIGNNIKYPDEAKKEGTQGRVFVTFIVEKDGQISNVEILRGIGGGCDEEAMRVIKNMPNWTPGLQRGEPVRVQYRLPIKFALQ
ncbi:MAG: M56 family metallopeptidase [Bacteroidales bacterium]|jgi:TonB family protein|nr:M56 family metallopeptidase [Bacteroidales bacterium]